jgi:hypothetical protein
MSYSDKNRAWNRSLTSAHDARIQWEIEYASALRSAHPEMTRDAALRQAAVAFDQQQY